MSFFTIIGMFVAGIAFVGIIGLIFLLIKDFFDYQRGARHIRKYCYSGPKRNELFWIKYGLKIWFHSFRRGGGWHTETADPDDDAYNLRIYHIYHDGRVVRVRVPYYG